ncbi:uncharacterized protein G2W53_001066 [Senna tora]|uniref:Uncharacterized protein n=1 Tax=Senna tora TaxID=362788 RepID=A0A834XHT9_9FABA|nr:uncharacterized protein G2W53_001066 [Senna tora]
MDQLAFFSLSSYVHTTRMFRVEVKPNSVEELIKMINYLLAEQDRYFRARYGEIFSSRIVRDGIVQSVSITSVSNEVIMRNSERPKLYGVVALKLIVFNNRNPLVRNIIRKEWVIIFIGAITELEDDEGGGEAAAIESDSFGRWEKTASAGLSAGQLRSMLIFNYPITTSRSLVEHRANQPYARSNSSKTSENLDNRKLEG